MLISGWCIRIQWSIQKFQGLCLHWTWSFRRRVSCRAPPAAPTHRCAVPRWRRSATDVRDVPRAEGNAPAAWNRCLGDMLNDHWWLGVSYGFKGVKNTSHDFSTCWKTIQKGWDGVCLGLAKSPQDFEVSFLGPIRRGQRSRQPRQPQACEPCGVGGDIEGQSWPSSGGL